MLVYYIDPNDKELVNNSEFIKEFLENNLKTPHRLASIEEYETLTAIASLDLSLELKSKDRFTNIKVDTLCGILMKIYGDNTASYDIILNSINMAFSKDEESSTLGLCLLIKASLTNYNNKVIIHAQFLRELCALMITAYGPWSHDLIRIYSLSVEKVKNKRASIFLYKLLTRNIKINNMYSDMSSLSNYYKLVMEKINPEFAKLM